MENYLEEVQSILSEVFHKLELAEQAQEEDDNAGEELDRTKEQFVQRIIRMQHKVGEIQKEISNIIYEHNNIK